MYNKAEFKPASVYFTSKSIGSESVDTQVKVYHTGDRFDYELSDGGRLYINPNVEEWFIAQDGASGSQGTILGGNLALTIDHAGSGSLPSGGGTSFVRSPDHVNSLIGFYN